MVRPPQVTDNELPEIKRIEVLVSVPSGEIRTEAGADGTYLLFDCDCLDALPFCKAQCCALIGTYVHPDEYENIDYKVDIDHTGQMILHRDADGFCTYLDRSKRCCSIYEDRPQTCKQFHCTRGAHQRGWKLANHVHRQSSN